MEALASVGMTVRPLYPIKGWKGNPFWHRLLKRYGLDVEVAPPPRPGVARKMG